MSKQGFRIYAVTGKNDKTTTIVAAISSVQAIDFVYGHNYEARILKPQEVVQAALDGTNISNAMQPTPPADEPVPAQATAAA